ncbi:MAG: Unknown protein [uncultured Aureispira sp.]|uniref:NAD(P)-binding domain-containing protein n=1 Tax=uncultured Aureispira sp. TaxID=1331704 RepID=A0A6S6U679_9BACT|nr:MAG: Unknown protein [uncultured Aureispira sp.]
MSKKALIIGGTGMLGKPVANQMIKDGYQVSIFSTNKKRAKEIFPNAIIIEGNLKDVASVKKAVEGQDAIYMNLGIATTAKQKDWNPERDGVKTVVEAAKNAGVKRIGYLSPKIAEYGNWWVMDDKRKAVKTIKESGIPYYIFKATSFMDNFNTTQREGNKINVVGKSNVKMHYIAAEDYAKQVSKAFALENKGSKVYSMQGETAYTVDEAATVFVHHYSKEQLKVAKAPMGLLKFIGLFNPTLSYVTKLMEALNNHPEKFDAEETWKDLGKPTISLEQYAKK